MSGGKKKLFLVDGHGHIYAAYYAPMRPLSAPNGEPTKAVFVFTNALLGLLERQKPDMLAVVMDPKAPSFRAAIYPDYKAHRPPMPEDMPRQIERIEQILDALRIPMLRVEGFEADDVMATLAQKAAQRGIDCYICSKDKDMLQILQDGVYLYDVKTDTVTDAKTLYEQTGLRPEQFLDVLALQGDTADNIPGVADVGPKTAQEWIRQYGSLDSLFANADAIGGKRGENLRASKQQAYLSRTLATLRRDAPVELDVEALAVKKPDQDKLYRIFSELGFSRLISQLGLKAPQDAPKPAPKTSLFDHLEQAPSAASIQTVSKDYQLIDSADKLRAFAARLADQPRFAFDTETTGLDPMRAQLVALSFSWSAHQGYYLPVKAPWGQPHLTIEQVQQAVGPILADPSRLKIAQNLKYDWLICRNAGLPVALSDGKAFDTMIASYLLWPDRASHSLNALSRDLLGYEPIPIDHLIGKGRQQIPFDQVDTAAACRYAAEDADVTFQLYEVLSKRLESQPRLNELFEKVEMPLVEALATMEANGVSLNVPLLRRMGNQIGQQIQRLAEQIYDAAGATFNIDSTKQLADILFDRLGLQSVKLSKTQRSTDAQVLEQIADQHPIVPLILRYRQLVKLKNTYIDKLPELIHPRTGRVHASFNQTVTATGRLSSSDPNLQNIPARSELGRQIRAAFVPADADGCILSADYSQIELRLLAHFSQDPALIKAFADDMDIHRFVAAQIYGVPLDAVSDAQRAKAKAVNFGIIYGQGAYGLSQSVGISQQEAKQFIDDYFARYKSIRAFFDQVLRKTKTTGYAETILGRRRPIAGLESKNFAARAQAERLAINTVIQGSAADLIKVAMTQIHQDIKTRYADWKMILQIHDELVFELPKRQAETAKQHIGWRMTTAIPLNVPLKVDIAVGDSWLESQ